MVVVETQNIYIMSFMNILNSLSFYSPIIICVGIVFFSILTSSMVKAFALFVCLFIVTCIRIVVIKIAGISNDIISEDCLSAMSQYVPKDVTYSIYLLSFIMMYFIFPMFMISIQKNVNMVNYNVLAFFIFYIALDISVKTSLKCIPGIFSSPLPIMVNILGGVFLGGFIAGLIMYGSNLKSYLYINEINTNKEVCSMPSKQQFKCRVFKDGTLIGNI
jgi:hypothetical protein